jgi:hexosaminidase
MNSFALLPAPRQLELAEGTFALIDKRLILLDSAAPQALRFATARFQRSFYEHVGLTWEAVASKATPQEQIALTLRVTPESSTPPQGYAVSIAPDGISITARDEAGVFYGICTLIQILESQTSHLECPISNLQLPCLNISDWPDFPARGVMLDVSRDKVPTLDTLLALVDLLAGWKVNQLQLYMEHTFAYRNHPEVWADASPFTGQDILELDAYCRQRHIELVPNQNSFGHMHRWLIHPRYAPLAEVTEGFMTPWGHQDGPFSLCPLDPGSLELVRSLYDELLPHFASRMFNVGCDETFDVGQGRSKAECEKLGAGRVYLDFLLKIYREAKGREHTMQFWGDIIVQQPEFISELPQDIVALEWGYEANHPFDEHGAQFAAAGIPFYVCPGTSSWRSLAGRTDNALGNLLNAAESGLKHGAIGYLNTDWGDDGHWQVLPVSYLGLAVGAACSWALDANRDMDVPRAVSLYAFRDPTGAMGRVAYDLGNVYKAVGIEPPNSSALFVMLQWPLEQVRLFQDNVPPPALHRTLNAIDEAMHPLAQARIVRPDAELIKQEYLLTARLMRHACRRGLLAFETDPAQVTALRRALDHDMQELIAQYRQVWLARNRPGGLTDSVARLEKARQAYLAA